MMASHWGAWAADRRSWSVVAIAVSGQLGSRGGQVPHICELCPFAFKPQVVQPLQGGPPGPPDLVIYGR